MIPKVFHRVWVGPDPVPEEFEATGESWRRHHPSWEMRLWTEDNLPELFRPEGADRLRNPTERSELLRYELLRQFGGVYVDMDFEALRPLDPLIEDTDFFVGHITKGRIGSAIIGSVPGHPVLERAVREVRPREQYGYDKDAAGPHFLDHLLKDHPDATRFGVERFYPRLPDHPDAYAYHHEARAWKSHAEMNEQIKRTKAKLAENRERVARIERRSQARIDEAERRRDELAERLAAIEQTRWWRLRERARAALGGQALSRTGS